MNISFSWLKRYIDFDLAPETAKILTSIGLEVASLSRSGETIKRGLEGFGDWQGADL